MFCKNFYHRQFYRTSLSSSFSTPLLFKASRFSKPENELIDAPKCCKTTHLLPSKQQLQAHKLVFYFAVFRFLVVHVLLSKMKHLRGHQTISKMTDGFRMDNKRSLAKQKLHHCFFLRNYKFECDAMNHNNLRL